MQTNGKAPRSYSKAECLAYVDTMYLFWFGQNQNLNLTWMRESRTAAEVTLQIYDNLRTFNVQVLNKTNKMLPQQPMDINTWLGSWLHNIST